MAYDDTDPDADGVVEADVNNEATTTEKANITNRWDFEPGYTESVGKIVDDANYNSEPHVERLNNGDILVVYRKGNSHVGNNGDLYYKLASDVASLANATEQLLVSSNVDDRNHAVVVDRDSGDITVIYRRYDESAGTTDGLFKVRSTDNAQSWGSPSEVTAPSLNAPFGDGVKTSNGLMVCLYETGTVETIFSTDAGSTWGNAGTISVGGWAEPVPVAINEDDILIVTRVGTGKFGHIKSTDGGSSWSSGTAFGLPFNTAGTPLWAEKTGKSTVTFAFGERTSSPGPLRTLSAPAKMVFDDPTILADATWQSIVEPQASDTAEWGYPSIVSLGPHPSHNYVAWHDEDNPNIWAGSMSPGSTPTTGPYTARAVAAYSELVPLITLQIGPLNDTFGTTTFSNFVDVQNQPSWSRRDIDLENIGDIYCSWTIRKMGNDTSDETTSVKPELSFGGNEAFGPEITVTGAGDDFDLRVAPAELTGAIFGGSDTSNRATLHGEVSGGQGSIEGIATIQLWGEVQ